MPPPHDGIPRSYSLFLRINAVRCAGNIAQKVLKEIIYANEK